MVMVDVSAEARGRAHVGRDYVREHGGTCAFRDMRKDSRADKGRRGWGRGGATGEGRERLARAAVHDALGGLGRLPHRVEHLPAAAPRHLPVAHRRAVGGLSRPSLSSVENVELTLIRVNSN